VDLEDRHGGTDDFVLHDAVVAGGVWAVKTRRIFDFRLGFRCGRGPVEFSIFRFSIFD
jgi:hypothetical protein